MEEMQAINLGYLAVSLGFYKTLFSAQATQHHQRYQKTKENIGLSDDLLEFL